MIFFLLFCGGDNLGDWFPFPDFHKILAASFWMVREANFCSLVCCFYPISTGLQQESKWLFLIISLLNSLSDGQSVANCLQVRTDEHGGSAGSSYTPSFAFQTWKFFMALGILKVFLEGKLQMHSWLLFLRENHNYMARVYSEGFWLPGAGEKICRNTCVCVAWVI